MPFYSYRCSECRKVEEEYHAAGTTPNIVCPHCGAQADRLYSAPRVNWGGLKPSDGELHPEIRQHIDNIDASRDRFAAEHEAHERRTEKEKEHGK